MPRRWAMKGILYSWSNEQPSEIGKGQRDFSGTDNMVKMWMISLPKLDVSNEQWWQQLGCAEAEHQAAKMSASHLSCLPHCSPVNAPPSLTACPVVPSSVLVKRSHEQTVPFNSVRFIINQSFQCQYLVAVTCSLKTRQGRLDFNFPQSTFLGI